MQHKQINNITNKTANVCEAAFADEALRSLHKALRSLTNPSRTAHVTGLLGTYKYVQIQRIARKYVHVAPPDI